MYEGNAMITPKEAVDIAVKHGLIDGAAIAYEVAKEYQKRTASGAAVYDRFMMCEVLFEAGRIQGIREERNRRKGKRLGK